MSTALASSLQLEELYAALRAKTLARHFALGRYFRANYFSVGNDLGEYDGTGAVDCRTQWHMTGYDDLASLLELDTVRETRERWRIVQHIRENPLMVNGMRLMQFAIEHRLGNPRARTILRLNLRTIGSLYKEDADGPFGGYVLRYDAYTSDRWETVVDSKGRVIPLTSCNFFLSGDPTLHDGKHSPYLDCTPLDHPTYVLGKRANDGVIIAAFRHHEPSMDELVGLLAGYAMVWRLVDDAEIRALVRAQTERLGRYLARFGYLLVRPCGGFAARGAAAVSPAVEHAFSSIFEGITGDRMQAPMSSTTARYASDESFVYSLRASGVWPCVEESFTSAGIAGAAAGVNLDALAGGGPIASAINAQVASMLVSRLGEQQARNVLIKVRDTATNVGLAPGSTLGFVVGRALALLERRDCFDVWLNSEEEKTSFAPAYLLKWIPPDERFRLWMATPTPFLGASADWKPFIGLIALAFDDPVVKDAYLDWYDTELAGANAGDEVFVTTDRPARTGPSFAAAIAALLRGRPADERKVVSGLNAMHATLTGTRLRATASDPQELPLTLEPEGRSSTACPPGQPDFRGMAEFHDKQHHAWFGGYMATLALAWLHQRRKLGRRLPLGFPVAPRASRFPAWPRALVPRDVIQQARLNRLVLPLRAIRKTPLPATIPAGGLDVLSAPPPKANVGGASFPPPGSVTFRLEVRAEPLAVPPHAFPPGLPQNRASKTEGRPAPPIAPELRSAYFLLLSGPARDADSIRDSELSITPTYLDNEGGASVTVTVESKTEIVLDSLGRPQIRSRPGLFKGTFTLSWVKKQIEPC